MTCETVRQFSLGRQPTVSSSLAVITAPKGRASQMNAGAKAAGREWLLFLHVDTVLPAHALSRLNAPEPELRFKPADFSMSFWDQIGDSE